MSSYDSPEQRSNFGLYVFLAFIAAALIAIGFYFSQRGGTDATSPRTAPSENEVVAEETPAQIPAAIDPATTGMPIGETPVPQDAIVPPTPEQMLMDAGLGVAELDPQILLQKIAKSLEGNDLKQLSNLVGKGALNEDQLRGLQALARKGDYRLSAQNSIIEVGELEANRRSRWAVNLEDGSRIYFDLVRGDGGRWGVAGLALPAVSSAATPTGQPLFTDSLGVTDAFLQAALTQDFDKAKSYVDVLQVSDAKIAGLCIIFEEAKYKLRDKKPLRAMFNRDLTAGFIAHVEDENGEKASDFGVTLQRASVDQPWLLTEINIDSLLANYADTTSGGDVHFTPLVKNPAGGDTLILYFGFDEDGLTPRTERQLDIVAGLLKLDPKKKLTLSGHTDALGSDEYNNGLSGNRAGSVKKYLLQVGVPTAQIVTLAEGEAKPRLPNSTADGQDSPTGRRANRRTEIYLDF